VAINSVIIQWGWFQTLQGNVWYTKDLPISYTSKYVGFGQIVSNGGTSAGYYNPCWRVENVREYTLSTITLGNQGVDATWWIAWMTIGY